MSDEKQQQVETYIKKLREFALKEQERFAQEQSCAPKLPSDSPCPHCGYCPHCGRGGHWVSPWVIPTNPFPPSWPYHWNGLTYTL